jgi:ribosomal protein L11 methyltransferase
MVETRLEIPVEELDAVEEGLLEVGDLRWRLEQDALAGRAWLVGVFSDESEAREEWERLSAALALPGSPEMRPVVDQEWRESYKEHFKAWRFRGLVWAPVWERENLKLEAGEQALWLDPGMAFGTGNHETTRLCVERMINFAEQALAAGREVNRMRVIDAGCGSGILALSAAKLGFGEIFAFDNDAEAVRISEENAAMNGLAGRVHFATADVAAGLSGPPADLILANIQADVLISHASVLMLSVAPSGFLAMSGILASEIQQVRAHFESLNLGGAFDQRQQGEWADLVWNRSG